MCVALSTAEAEYMTLSSASQEEIWMRELNSDMGNEQSQPTFIFEDNQSAITMAKNPLYHGRSKHNYQHQVSFCIRTSQQWQDMS